MDKLGHSFHRAQWQCGQPLSIYGCSWIRIEQIKGGKDRMVPVGERALAWLEKFLAQVRPLLAVHAEVQTLFLTGYGRGFSPNSLGNLVKQILRKAHPDRPGNCHLLRHACATHMLEHGADVRIIQQLLGHAKLETTQIYTEVSIRLLQDVHARTHPACQ